MTVVGSSNGALTTFVRSFGHARSVPAAPGVPQAPAAARRRPGGGDPTALPNPIWTGSGTEGTEGTEGDCREHHGACGSREGRQNLAVI